MGEVKEGIPLLAHSTFIRFCGAKSLKVLVCGSHGEPVGCKGIDLFVMLKIFAIEN